jgi:hypothetical protein
MQGVHRIPVLSGSTNRRFFSKAARGGSNHGSVRRTAQVGIAAAYHQPSHFQ